MIRKFYIESLDWTLKVICLRPSFDPSPILLALGEYRPSGKELAAAKSLMRTGNMNWGFTFSSYPDRSSLMVIGPSTDQSEYFNTIVHETYHMAKHVAQCDRLDPYSEDVAYIAGDAVKLIYEAFKDMVCLCENKRKTQE